MRINKKYVVAVALLAVLAVVFGFAGAFAPMSKSVVPKQLESDSVTHFMNPPTYDSDWVNITDKLGQSFTLTHDLINIHPAPEEETLVDVVGRRSLTGGNHKLFFGTTYAQAWNKTYGGMGGEMAWSVVETSDRGYALAGLTDSYGAGPPNFWLVKTGGQVGFSIGLSMTDFTNSTITLYRGIDDPYWNYVRVRIWVIEEPTWMFGDINQDGVVDVNDLVIIGENYGKTFSALSLGGIIAIAGIYTYKKRKQPKQATTPLFLSQKP